MTGKKGIYFDGIVLVVKTKGKDSIILLSLKPNNLINK